MFESTWSIHDDMVSTGADATDNRSCRRQPITRADCVKTWALVQDKVLRLAAAIHGRGRGEGDGVAILGGALGATAPHGTPQRRRRRSALAGASATALLAGLLVASGADAIEFERGELSGSFDTTITLGTLFRVQDRDPDLIGFSNASRNGGEGNLPFINSDNGNLNYDKGLVSAAARVTHELSLSYDNVGAFARATYFYDPINSPSSSERGSRTNEFELSQEAIDRVGNDFRLLDAFVYGSFNVGETSVLDLRFGNQVLSWGESTFIQNGLNVINPVIVSALRVPGTEVKEGFLPVALFNAKFSLSESWSLEGFYQFQWDQSEPEAANTFFSTNDFASPGADFLIIGGGNPLIPDSPTATAVPGAPGNVVFPGTFRNVYTGDVGPVVNAAGQQLNQASFVSLTPLGSFVPRLDDDTPQESGQFGFAFRHFASWLNDTEFGVYYLNYHSRLPLLSGFVGPRTALANPRTFTNNSGYRAEYPEDIQALGVSFNTLLPGGVALQGEYTYRIDQPLQFDDVELLQATLAAPSLAGVCGPAAAPGAPASAVASCLGNARAFATNQIIQALGGIDTSSPSAVLASTGGLFGQRIQGWGNYGVSQWQFTASKALPPTLGTDQIVLVGEVGFNYAHDLPDPTVLRLEGPGTVVGGNPVFSGSAGQPYTIGNEFFATPFSWGYRMVARFDFLNAFQGVNLFPSVSWQHDPHGITPSPVSNFIEGRKALALGVRATFLEQWQADVVYTSFFGAGVQNAISDRDFVALSLKYSF